MTVGVRAAGVLGLLGLLAAGCARAPKPLDDPDRWSSGECRARLTIEHERSPLAELRELGGWSEGFQERFPAAVIDPAAQRPVTATAALRLDGQPIAWLGRSLDAVVLDGAAFAPLRRVDATRAVVGERAVVGRVAPRARRALGDRAVLELLLRIDAIHAYWHLGADLCIVTEQVIDGAYRAELHGVHQYVSTAARRPRTAEARFGFAVEIDREGEVAVTGLEMPSPTTRG